MKKQWLQVLIYINKKMILIKKSKLGLYGSFVWISILKCTFMYIHEHLAYFVILMFSLKVTRKLLFYFSCCDNCGPLYAIRLQIFNKWLSRFLGFCIIDGVFININTSLIIGRNTSFSHLKIAIISCWKIFIWMFTKSCLLKSLH